MKRHLGLVAIIATLFTLLGTPALVVPAQAASLVTVAQSTATNQWLSFVDGVINWVRNIFGSVTSVVTNPQDEQCVITGNVYGGSYHCTVNHYNVTIQIGIA